MHHPTKLGAALIAVFVTFAAAASAQSDREQATANFQEADANSDGALTFDEFTRFVDLNAEDNLGRARMIQRAGRYKMAFGRLDANQDGLATAEEMAALTSQ